MDGLEGCGKRAMMSVLNNGRSQEGSFVLQQKLKRKHPKLSVVVPHAPRSTGGLVTKPGPRVPTQDGVGPIHNALDTTQ